MSQQARHAASTRGIMVLVGRVPGGLRTLLVVALALGASGLGLALDGGAAEACPHGVRTLRVVAAPEMAPAIREVAPSQAARCRRVVVTARPAAQVVDDLRRGATRPDVWIPDSSMWVQLAADAGVRPGTQTTSIARSPAVLAVTRPAAERLGWPKRRLDFRRLLSSAEGAEPVLIGWPDPARSASAVTTLVGLQQAAATLPRGRADLAAALRYAEQGLPSDSARLLRAARLNDWAVPVSEQAAWASNAKSTSDVVAAYPTAPAASLDYPYVVMATEPESTVDAARLLAGLQAPTGRQLLDTHGFRDSAGHAGQTLRDVIGIDAKASAGIGTPTADELAAARQILAIMNRGSRLLAVIDVSGSMGRRVPGEHGATRIDLTRRAAAAGLRLFPDDSVVGLWEFSTHLTRRTDYRELVPIGPLAGGPRGTGRAALADAVRDIRHIPRGWTGLYDTTLAAVREVRAGYDPDRINAVVLLSDGANYDDAGLDLEQLLDRLRAQDDPRRPVPVISVAYGPDSDAAALRAISDATGGATYVAADPGRIRAVFLDALGQRPCRPDC